MQVVVEPLRRVLEVRPGANLLEVLREHALPVSYSCMAGRCGTCRCRVLAGEVLDAGAEAQRPQAADRTVLACQTVLTGPCTIEIPEPDEPVVHPARLLKAGVVAIEPLAHDIRRLRLRTNKPLAFSPGQYAQLQLAPGLVRPYSMAGLPGDDELEFHVRLVPGGRASEHVARLAVGDAVRVGGPLGSAYLRARHAGPMLCVAGGTGLAPVLSIVRGAIAAGMDNPIHVYVGARSPRDVYGLAWLEALQRRHAALRVHVVVSAAGGDHRWRRGLVTEAIAQDRAELRGWRAYLAGAPPLVEAATRLARERGVDEARLHADAFYASA